MKSKLSFIRRYRFNLETIQMLDKLKTFGISETDFVRLAINEKLFKELPGLKKREYNNCPF